LDDGAWHLVSDDIFDSSNADQDEVSLFNSVDLAALSLVLNLVSLLFLEVLVGESNGSQGLLGVDLDDLIELLHHVVIKLGLGAVLSQVVGTGLKHDLRSALDVESLGVAELGGLIFKQVDDG
jgi:hypothetical protein